MSILETQGLVKHPVDAVFAANRDALALAIAHVDDLEYTVEERLQGVDGVVELRNVWRASIPIPPIVQSVIEPRMVVWTDRSIWTSHDRTARWSIFAPYFPDRVHCSGVTTYEETVSGQTRVTMRGKIEIDARGIGLPTMAEQAIARGVEEFVAGMFPWSFRKVIDGVSRHLSDRARAAR